MPKTYQNPRYPYRRSADQGAGAGAAHHPVVIVGAGLVGLAAAVDLAQQGIATVVLDDDDTVSFGSRAICFAKRSLEILDRLGLGEQLQAKGVTWNKGKVFWRDSMIYDFDLLPEGGHRWPAFINLQQYYAEEWLVERALATGLVDLRWKNRVVSVVQDAEAPALEVETPDGTYRLTCDYLLAADGARSTVRRALGLDFTGQVFRDRFLICDVVMKADFPSERWFWFDPPFNRGQSALLHKQPDNVWRIDLQLGWDIDKEREKRPENVIPRLKAMLGENVEFELEWVSIYTFQCRRMENFRHGRVVFAGDSAHQVSPFGARGANSGLQDTDNLGWKLGLVINGQAPESLLDTYNSERVTGADENIRNSTRSTDFITPKSDMSRLLRDAVLDLSQHHEFARPLVNSGRLSVPCTYQGSPLNTADALNGPSETRPGRPCPDVPLDDGYLLPKLGGKFILLTINADAPEEIEEDGVKVTRVAVTSTSDPNSPLVKRYLGREKAAVYLIRPDQHVAARRPSFDENLFRTAIRRATGKE